MFIHHKVTFELEFLVTNDSSTIAVALIACSSPSVQISYSAMPDWFNTPNFFEIYNCNATALPSCQCNLFICTKPHESPTVATTAYVPTTSLLDFSSSTPETNSSSAPESRLSLIAGVSGGAAAVIILAVLVLVVVKRKRKNKIEQGTELETESRIPEKPSTDYKAMETLMVSYWNP